MDSTDNDVLQATVSGGWNIVDTALTINSHDSADLLNVDVDVDGSIVKRRGFTTELGFTGLGNASSFVPIQLKSGYNIIVHDDGTDLLFSHRDIVASVPGNTNVWRRVNYPDVFGTNNALQVTTDVVISNEPLSTRIIILRPNHIPIQVQCIETSGTFFTGVVTNTVTIEVPALWSDYDAVLIGGAWMWVDGAWNEITNFVYSAATVSTFTMSTPVSIGQHTIHACYFTYQAWSEGNKLDVTQVLQQVTQANGQKHVSIPSILLRDVGETLINGLYPMLVLQSTNYDNVFTRTASLAPTLVSEYTFSVGAETAAATPYVPSPFFVSFGEAPVAARGVLFHRGYTLDNYNGGKRPNFLHLAVCLFNNTTGWSYSNSVPASEGGVGTGSFKYSFRVRNGNYGTFTGTGTARYISFDQTSTANGGLGLPQDDILIYGINEPLAYSLAIIGTNYQSFVTDLRRTRRGVQFPIFGIQDFCSYAAGGSGGTTSFPSTGCVYQRRLVLAGMPSSPNLIAFSEVQDQTIPGQYYRNFQTTLEDGTATNGFIILLPTENNERIVCVREFQGSLFVWTNISLYRINGLSGVPFSDGNFDINKIASVGCINPRSTITTSNSAYWLSNSGVYAIQPNDTAAGYGVAEVSQKIRPLFLNDLNSFPELASWACYDASEQRLYVGVPSKRVAYYNTASYNLGTARPYESDTLLVYHESRGAWTRYTNMGGLNMYARGMTVEYTTSRFDDGLTESVGSSNLYLYGTDTNGGLLTGKQPRYIDQTLLIAITPGSPTIDVVSYKQWVWSTTTDRLIYDPADVVVGDPYSGIQLSKIVSLEDALVFYGGALLVFGVDWYKTSEGAIALMFNPTTGTQLYVLPAQRVNGTLTPMIGAYKNDEPLLPGIDFTASTAIVPVFGISGLVLADNIRIGTTYPSYHVSPSFTRQTILSWKRIKQWAGYYDNAFLIERWKASTSGTRYGIIGTAKNYVNFDLIFLFNNEQDGFIDSEVYESNDLTWDVSSLSLGSGATLMYKQYSRLTVPILGSGYTFQFVHYNANNSAFKLSGYQIIASIKPGKGRDR